MSRLQRLNSLTVVSGLALLIAGCGGSSEVVLSAATPAKLQSCTDLVGKIKLANTSITSTELVAAITDAISSL